MERSHGSAAAGLAAVCVLLLVVPPGCSQKTPAPDAPPMLRVGHVGHDHHLALYVAAQEGERFRQRYGVHLQLLKEQEVYDLVEGGKTLARLRLIKVAGGSNLPTTLARGELDVGLGAIVPAIKLADAGEPLKLLSPLQADGDMLVMRKDSPISDWPAFVAAAKSSGRPLKIGYKAPLATAKMVFEGALAAEAIPFGHDPVAVPTGVLMMDFGSESSPIPLLATGALDGFVMNQPGPALAEDKGAGKIVCQLRDLPPKGKWVDHPCCVVMAREQAIRDHPQALRAFLKIIHLGTQMIRDEPGLAVEHAHRWTGCSLSVERASVPTVTYGTEFTESWLRGLRTWRLAVKDLGFFQGKFKAMDAEQFIKEFCHFDLCGEAARELRDKGWLK